MNCLLLAYRLSISIARSRPYFWYAFHTYRDLMCTYSPFSVLFIPQSNQLKFIHQYLLTVNIHRYTYKYTFVSLHFVKIYLIMLTSNKEKHHFLQILWTYTFRPHKQNWSFQVMFTNQFYFLFGSVYFHQVNSFS